MYTAILSENTVAIKERPADLTSGQYILGETLDLRKGRVLLCSQYKQLRGPEQKWNDSSSC
jgi:hypothetical protein